MSPDESSKRQRRNKIIIVVLVFLLLLYFGSRSFISCSFPAEKQLATAIENLNHSCPYMVDDEVRIDSVNIIYGKTVQYYYTIPGAKKDDIDLTYVLEELKPEAIRKIQTSPDLKLYRDNNIGLSYIYYDQEGVFIHRIDITPEMYKAK